MRQKTKFAKPFNRITPVQPLREKYFYFFFSEKCHSPAIPPHERGVRVVTNVEAGCGGHAGLRKTSAITWTEKLCGPGAATLALSLQRR